MSQATAANATRKVALVTGANKGIGYNIARQLATLSNPAYTVLMASRDPTRGSASLAQLMKEVPSASLRSVTLDVCDRSSIQAVAKLVKDEYGELDLLVNNAGVFDKPGDKGHSAKVVDHTLATNYYAPLHMCEEFLPIINKNGRVVTVSSELGTSALSRFSNDKRATLLDPNLTVEKLNELVASFRESFVAGHASRDGWLQSAYGVSKALVSVLMRVLAKQAKNGVTLFAACPGWCRTDMTSPMATRSAEEGASMIMHVCMLPPNDQTSGAHYENKKVVEL